MRCLSACKKWTQCSFLPRDIRKLPFSFCCTITICKSARSENQQDKEHSSRNQYNQIIARKRGVRTNSLERITTICAANIHLTLHEHSGATLAISDCGNRYFVPFFNNTEWSTTVLSCKLYIYTSVQIVDFALVRLVFMEHVERIHITTGFRQNARLCGKSEMHARSGSSWQYIKLCCKKKRTAMARLISFLMALPLAYQHSS